ncbi:MOSC domain-containing protein [Aphelenchoides fujianensis]|nr:MOSC domain-containing protein [Aphelenchoides fujianensis]KAI6238658.1 MOSC domain-containing protein [Aphelenchoides fujianensis]
MERVRVPVAVGLLAAVGAATFFVWTRRRRARAYWEAPWTAAGRVERLCVYPVKSCKGILTDWLDCELRGVRSGERVDREFLLVDEAHGNALVSARQCPRLVLVEVQVADGRLELRFPTGRRVLVDLAEVERRRDVRPAILHENTRTDGLDCGDEAAAAFADFLQVGGRRRLRLLRFAAGLFTERDARASPAAWQNAVPPDFQDHITFNDDAAFMLMTTRSVDALNARLAANGEEPVSVDFFRPVIAVADAPAHDEDRWLEVRVGGAEFACYRACSRCVLTTVDPTSGRMRADGQPLKAMRGYRLAPAGRLRDFYGRSPLFGVYAGLRRAGRVRVGDEVFVRYKPSPF